MSDSLAKQLKALLQEDPYAPFPIKQAEKLTIKPANIEKPKKNDGWKLAALLPDTQIGYRVYEDGSVIEFHSEDAIDVAMQIVKAANEEYGVDTIVNLGDTLDLPAQSRHQRP